ncbi:GTP pyrophosphokinase [Streptococcus saliviloxodontae]|uniref:PpGpp synthetase/RelA/SpoT-type nucleotidyltransferase n=1 Tax=Streptococcus saliviloxodontae TaxID=1349416 RepID=A0ABS2PPT7_9STRE|nr:GTP pyrophosphokinase family protein [Streptococcus saliviloxodontae]MBM7636808.1 ppGpp synthetase/RelA/SpoT-type nucleotidyltransferase [Streptococcus saliviloxodontae]
MSESIYGEFSQYLPLILQQVTDHIIAANKKTKEETGFKLYEHFISRIKASDSMAEKCQRKGLEVCPQSALRSIRDSIGIRIVCGFVDDIYKTVSVIKAIPGVSIYNEKDYISKAKPNGYRSYHLILEMETDYPDVLGNARGSYFIEVQLRTIAQDSWASLEHQMKYKHDIKHPEMITKELKRCADELASCDLTMQTIRNLIQESSEDN